MLYTTVMCIETGELINQLPTDANTALMRAKGTYLNLDSEAEYLIPCGGADTKVSAYWRGLRGNKVRARELDRQCLANDSHRV